MQCTQENALRSIYSCGGGSLCAVCMVDLRAACACAVYIVVMVDLRDHVKYM